MHMRCLFRSTSRFGRQSRRRCRSFARRWSPTVSGWGALVLAMGLPGRAGSSRAQIRGALGRAAGLGVLPAALVVRILILVLLMLPFGGLLGWWIRLLKPVRAGDCLLGAYCPCSWGFGLSLIWLWCLSLFC